MGTDKYKITYHDLPQYQHLQDLFHKMGLEAYLSISTDQQQDFRQEEHTISDAYEARGPIGGILSAMQQFPETSWLVVACDLPLINERHLRQLIGHSTTPHQVVTYQVHREFYETTCTLYHSSCLAILEDALRNGKGSLQKALQQMTVKTLVPPQATDLLNVNDQESYQRCLELLGR